MISYRLYLRSHGQVIQRQTFQAVDDPTAKDVADAVFHCTDRWDSFDLWDGSRHVGGPTARALDSLPAAVEELAVAIAEAIQSYGSYASDPKLAARIREIRDRSRPRRALNND